MRRKNDSYDARPVAVAALRRLRQRLLSLLLVVFTGTWSDRAADVRS